MIRRTLFLLACVASLDALAQRVVAITMDDTMRYDPSEITVKRGETVTFKGTNKGKLVHELVIGSKKQLEEHAEHMRKHPGMDHGSHTGDGMLRLEGGKSGEMSYRFTKAGTFYYGCLEPGHFEAGMTGKVTVR